MFTRSMHVPVNYRHLRSTKAASKFHFVEGQSRILEFDDFLRLQWTGLRSRYEQSDKQRQGRNNVA